MIFEIFIYIHIVVVEEVWLAMTYYILLRRERSLTNSLGRINSDKKDFKLKRTMD